MDYAVFASLAPIALLVTLVTLVFAWKRRTVPGAPALVVYLGMVAGLLVFNSLELYSTTEETSQLWAQLSYIFFAFLPPAWLFYALHYTGRTAWLAPRRFWFVLVVPALTVLFAQTNDLHHLIWEEWTFERLPEGFLVLRVMEYGQWFWIHLLNIYIMLAAGSYLVWSDFFTTHPVYRRQMVWSTSGVIVPLVSNILYLAQPAEALRLDFTPVGFAVSGVLFAVGVYRYRLLTLNPIARSVLVEMLPDGVLILDDQYRLVDFNPAARTILNLPNPAPVGLPVDQIWPESRLWLNYPPVPAGSSSHAPSAGVPAGRRAWDDLPTRPDVIRVERNGHRRAYSLLISPIKPPGAFGRGQAGWLLLFSDVTRRVEAESGLVAVNAALAESNQAQAEANTRLRELNEELESRVEARTRALALHASELESIATISSQMRQAISQDELLKILLEDTYLQLGAEAGYIFLLENGELVLRRIVRQAAGEGSPAAEDLALVEGLRHPPARDPLWETVETGKILHPRRPDLPLAPAAGEPQLFYAIASGQEKVILVPIRSADRTMGLLVLSFAAGPERAFADFERGLLAVAEMAGNALQRVRMMENLEALVNARTRSLSILYEITSVTNQFFDLPALLQRILEMMMDVLHLRMVLIHLFDEEGAVHLAASAGLDRERIGRLPALLDPDAPWQRVRALEKIVIVPSGESAGAPAPAGSNPAVPLLTAVPANTVDAGPAPDSPAAIALPVRAKGQLLGVLTILDESIDRFSTEDVALMAAIADHTGVAVESARLRHLAEQAAVMEERQRLARDLHDSVTQTLYSLVLFSEAGIDALDAGAPDKAARYLTRLRETSQQALREMRLLIFELRPLALQREGLAGALRYRLDSVERRSGVDAVLEINQSALLPEAVENGLYNIAQEALNNIIKHALANQVIVRLTAAPCPPPAAPGLIASLPARTRVELEIIDNGRGFQMEEDGTQSGQSQPGPGAPHLTGGLGLSNMRERARELGGALSIQSTTGQGTSVLVTLELEDTAHDIH